MPRLYRWASVVTFASLFVTAFPPQPLRALPEEGEVAIPFTLTAANNLVVSAVLNNKFDVESWQELLN